MHACPSIDLVSISQCCAFFPLADDLKTNLFGTVCGEDAHEVIRLTFRMYFSRNLLWVSMLNNSSQTTPLLSLKARVPRREYRCISSQLTLSDMYVRSTVVVVLTALCCSSPLSSPTSRPTTVSTTPSTTSFLSCRSTTPSVLVILSSLLVPSL